MFLFTSPYTLEEILCVLLHLSLDLARDTACSSLLIPILARDTACSSSRSLKNPNTLQEILYFEMPPYGVAALLIYRVKHTSFAYLCTELWPKLTIHVLQIAITRG